MKSLTRIILICISFQASAQYSSRELFNKEFTPAQLQEDFSFFRTSLEKVHPGLYRYTSRQAMDSIFNAALKKIGQPMKYKDFYKLLALVNTQIRCQHTAVAPNQEDLEQISKYGKMFPFE